MPPSRKQTTNNNTSRLSSDSLRKGISSGRRGTPTSKTKPSNVTYGIDISHWQGSYDPSSATKDVGFVILKSSEGAALDPRFEQFYKAAAGKVPVIGSYHYLRSDIDAQAQMRTVLQANAGKAVKFYAVDFEPQNNIMSPKFAQQALNFVKDLQDITGKPVYLYTNQALYEDYFKGTNVPLWLSSPSGKPYVQADPTFIQTSFKAPAAEYGVTGSQSVDLNVFPGSPAELEQTLATGAAPRSDWNSIISQITGWKPPKLPSIPALGSSNASSGSGRRSPNAPAQVQSAAQGGAAPTVDEKKSSSLVTVNLLPENVNNFLSSKGIGTTLVFLFIGGLLVAIGIAIVLTMSGKKGTDAYVNLQAKGVQGVAASQSAGLIT